MHGARPAKSLGHSGVLGLKQEILGTTLLVYQAGVAELDCGGADVFLGNNGYEVTTKNIRFLLSTDSATT